MVERGLASVTWGFREYLCNNLRSFIYRLTSQEGRETNKQAKRDQKSPWCSESRGSLVVGKKAEESPVTRLVFDKWNAVPDCPWSHQGARSNASQVCCSGSFTRASSETWGDDCPLVSDIRTARSLLLEMGENCEAQREGKQKDGITKGKQISPKHNPPKIPEI